jgi:dTDP-4-amino-4,6-dideoxygalactose transaminase
VALPGAMCHDVVVAVLAAGCEPVFCDIDVVDGLVKESEWARARSLGAEVAIVVHLYGNPARIGAVRSIFSAPGCLIIDDAAQALGSHSQDGLAGAMGDVGLLSFGITKHIAFGNAAVLFRDADFATEVESVLDGFSVEPEEVRHSVIAAFRSRLDFARARLRTEGDSAANAFAGLLEGLDPALYAPLSMGIEDCMRAALKAYPAAARARVAKANIWSRCLAGLGFEPVGMGDGCVPWRYVCRLPDVSWMTQHRVAEAMRAAAMHVSNWYLPAQWFVGQAAGTLPGVERLSREVFQFWVDDSVTHESIVRNAAAVRRALEMARDINCGPRPVPTFLGENQRFALVT